MAMARRCAVESDPNVALTQWLVPRVPWLKKTYQVFHECIMYNTRNFSWFNFSYSNYKVLLLQLYTSCITYGQVYVRRLRMNQEQHVSKIDPRILATTSAAAEGFQSTAVAPDLSVLPPWSRTSTIRSSPAAGNQTLTLTLSQNSRAVSNDCSFCTEAKV